MNDSAACPICYSNYNETDNLPRIIPICGHTICHTCIVYILKSLAPGQPFQCPLDKKNCPIQRNEVSFFPVNHALKDTLNEKNCPEHNKPLDIICTQEKILICYLCALTGSHKGHEVKPLKELMQGIQKKRKIMEGAFANVAKFQEEAEYIKNNRKGRILEFIEEKFEKAEVIEAARVRLDKDFGKQGLNHQDEDVDLFKLRIKEILKILEGDAGTGVINDIDDELIQSTLKMMDDLRFDQKLRDLQQSVTKFHINFDGRFSQAIQECCYFDDEVVPKKAPQSKVVVQEEIVIQRPENLRDLQGSGDFREEEKSDHNEILLQSEKSKQLLNKTEFVNHPPFQRSNLHARESQANGNVSVNNHHHNARENDLGPLYVMENQREGVLIIYSRGAHKIPQNARPVQNLVSLLDLDSIKKFKGVELEFPSTIWSAQTVDTLSYLIPNLQSLVYLRADFSESRIQRIDFIDFAYPLLKVADTLEEFNLNLDGTTLEDEEVSYLLINAMCEMKNLKCLDLNLLQYHSCSLIAKK